MRDRRRRLPGPELLRAQTTVPASAYHASTCAAKAASTRLRFNFIVGVRNPFSIDQGSRATTSTCSHRRWHRSTSGVTRHLRDGTVPRQPRYPKAFGPDIRMLYGLRNATCRKRSSLHKPRQYQCQCVPAADRACCGRAQATRASYRTGSPASGSSSRRFQRRWQDPIAAREWGSRRDSTVLPPPSPRYAHGQDRQLSCRPLGLEARGLRDID